MPVFHVTVGMIAAVQNALSLVCLLIAVRVGATVAPETAVLEPSLCPSLWRASLWTAACVTPPLMFALAGAYGSVWLSLRRNRDDFGRDYYNRMLPWAAGWARNAWICVWILLALSTARDLWPGLAGGGIDAGRLAIAGAQLLLWLFPPLLWTIFRKGKVALRDRWLLYVAWLVAIAYALPYFLEICSIPPPDASGIS